MVRELRFVEDFEAQLLKATEAFYRAECAAGELRQAGLVVSCRSEARSGGIGNSGYSSSLNGVSVCSRCFEWFRSVLEPQKAGGAPGSGLRSIALTCRFPGKLNSP